MENTTAKTLLAAAPIALFMTYFHQLLFPLVILGIIMLCDYISGVAAAFVHGELSSRTGVIGVIKKVAYLLIVVVGMAVDWTIRIAADQVGINAMDFSFFGLLVIVWLTLNECISILENVDRIGVNVPPFLRKIIEKLKQSAEKKGNEASEPPDKQ